MNYSLPKMPWKNVDLGHLKRGEGGQQKVTVLFTFENVENVGRSLKHIVTRSCPMQNPLAIYVVDTYYNNPPWP